MTLSVNISKALNLLFTMNLLPDDDETYTEEGEKTKKFNGFLKTDYIDNLELVSLLFN